MNSNFDKKKINYQYFFSFFIAIITYGFALTNFTLSIDNEIPILSDFGLNTGRWGQNLIKYHLLNGHLQYFTLLLSLFLFSISAVRLSKIFSFKGEYSYYFIIFFITFPQISYQIVFSMMADVAALGVLLSIFSIELFIKVNLEVNIAKKYFFFFISLLIIVFIISIYQALLIIPVLIYFIYYFQNTFNDDFIFKKTINSIISFISLIILSIILYYLSVKIICPPLENSNYLSSFTNGSNDNILINFIKLWIDNILGNFYYGEKLFVLVPIFILFILYRIFKLKKLLILRIIFLLLFVITPFLVSFFIFNGYHPPRIYVASNLVFAFILVFAFKIFNLKQYNILNIFVLFILISNVFFVSKLFYTCNKIYLYDKNIALKINNIILNKYPNFHNTEKTVYFYGCFPYEFHQKFRLEKSEIFGGSIFNWDNGNNYRIINFFKDSNVEELKLLESKEKFDFFKDSISKMPTWPNHESIKLFKDVVVVKLGNNKGMSLNFE